MSDEALPGPVWWTREGPRTKLIHSGPLIILMFCTVTLVAWKSVNKVGLTIESCFALAFVDCSVKAYRIH